MADSILNSVKKVLGISSDYTAFDVDILMYINSTFATLNQLGIGPVDGYEVENSTATWDDYLPSFKNLNSVKQYVAQKVRLAFDPPTTSFGIDALKNQLTELEWRINVVREGAMAGVETYDPFTVDGGSP